MPHNNESEVSKILLYIMSAGIGFAAKLATQHKKQPITLWDGCRQLLITVMSSWIVFWLCKKYNQDEVTTYIFGCISASFSNQVLSISWAWAKEFLKIILKIH